MDAGAGFLPRAALNGRLAPPTCGPGGLNGGWRGGVTARERGARRCSGPSLLQAGPRTASSAPSLPYGAGGGTGKAAAGPSGSPPLLRGEKTLPSTPSRSAGYGASTVWKQHVGGGRGQAKATPDSGGPGRPQSQPASGHGDGGPGARPQHGQQPRDLDQAPGPLAGGWQPARHREGAVTLGDNSTVTGAHAHSVTRHSAQGAGRTAPKAPHCADHGRPFLPVLLHFATSGTNRTLTREAASSGPASRQRRSEALAARPPADAGTSRRLGRPQAALLPAGTPGVCTARVPAPCCCRPPTEPHATGQSGGSGGRVTGEPPHLPFGEDPRP